jgi:RNA polymerase sigma-70 factor (ECF subfamily)
VAADLLQELFLRLGQSSGFDQADDPAAYAWRAAINLAMEWRRHRQHDPLIAAASVSEVDVALTEPSPLERMARTEQFEQLLDGVNDLSELSREVFLLRFIEEQSYGQIAGRLGKTPHQVRGICHAAVRQLRQMFADADSRDATIPLKKN